MKWQALIDMADLAIFDLDHTLIATDSADRWSVYMCENGMIQDTDAFLETHKKYEQRYKVGDIDMGEFIRFALKPLIGLRECDVTKKVIEFIEAFIRPHIYKKGVDVVRDHVEKGDTILLISATIEDLVNPVGKILGFKPENILAVNTEKCDERYTGNLLGTLGFGKGKVARTQAWLQQQKLAFDKTYFYSDSINDLPLLLEVDEPRVVNPDPKLLIEAKNRGWFVKYF